MLTQDDTNPSLQPWKQWPLRRPALPAEAQWPLRMPSPRPTPIAKASTLSESYSSRMRRLFPPLHEVIEEIGLGGAQLRLLFTAGGLNFADGAELLLVASVAKSVSDEWHLGNMERGLLVTLVYLGMMFGCFFAGPLGDKYGRRQVILMAFLGVFIFSVLSATAWSFASMATFRFLVGLSVGSGIPANNALASELTPTKWRTLANALAGIVGCFGSIFACILILCDDPEMVHLHWRPLVSYGAIPALLFGIATFFLLRQSPFFLAASGQHLAARQVLEGMRRDNCLPEEPVEFRSPCATPRIVSPQQTWDTQWRRIFRGPLLATTFVLMFSCFTMNFAGYGSGYAFPQILPLLDNRRQLWTSEKGTSAAMDLLYGTIWNGLGGLFGGVTGLYFARKPMMKILLLMLGFCIIMFVLGATNEGSHWWVLLWHIGFYGFQFFISAQWLTVYVYASEVYPTKVRTTGCGLAFGSGRLAAMVAPLAFEKVKEVSASFEAYFYVMAGLCFANLLIIDCLPFETFGKPLDDNDDDRPQAAFNQWMEWNPVKVRWDMPGNGTQRRDSMARGV